MLTGLSLIAAASIVVAAPYHDCVLAGPDFPPPANLAQSLLLKQATLKFEQLINRSSLGLKPDNAAWGVALFSSKENKTLYEQYYTPSIDVGVDVVDRDSIFRIGSITKVFSVWSFLLEVGDSYFNDPISKYVPELANLPSTVESDIFEDDLTQVKWDEVTLGELASQAAGIPRDPTENDLAAELSTLEAESLGFPNLPKSEIPVCGLDGVKRPCTRQEMFSYLVKERPIYAAQHSPAYSNIAFTLLGYAQEAITGRTFNETITTDIMGVLGMNNSSYETTPSSGGVIPGSNASEVGWDTNLGVGSPSGSIYSSTSDMIKAGKSILQSTLLSSAETRRWLKPMIQTGYLSTAVGAPWEIRYLTNPNQHTVATYTKQGDIGNYNAALALSPEHDLGWIVLAAGTASSAASTVRDELFNAFSDIFIPMAEGQAKEEAIINFNGTYVDETTNSSAVILVGDNGRAGLGVPELISRGQQIIGPQSELITLYNAGESARLYPSGLKTTKRRGDGCGAYDARLGFRATFWNETQANEMEDPCLLAWTALGTPMYGQRSIDDWVFEMGEDGRATALDVRILRLSPTRRD